MTALAKNTAIMRARSVRSGRFTFTSKGMFVRTEVIDESLEDARLNAIADERASGPFIRISLDDL